MANKRQKTDLKSFIPEKKVRENKTEFNGTVFKSMLKDPSRAFKGKWKYVRDCYLVNTYCVIEFIRPCSLTSPVM